MGSNFQSPTPGSPRRERVSPAMSPYPFWSDRARIEVELASSRPIDFEGLIHHLEISSIEAQRPVVLEEDLRSR